ncbi:Protein of unknown function [Vibrio xiamenensis]|uniref:DUF1800 domain-containing protein n=1 Tax=Vibrio xiamenensis TaxID=861298 RepID=A0A1G8A9Z5_9VIBR|nr:DUF1800 domain-containing protein [Vibrio xiamenensis]SDH17784.1 Protein of unknown function [Vibrio xiamenensis]
MKLRIQRKISTLALCVSALFGCNDSALADTSSGETVQNTAALSIEDLTTKQLHRFLNQASFGPTPALMENVDAFDLQTWLTEQFEAPVTSHEALYLELGNGLQSTREDAWLEIAALGDDQLRQRVAFALSEVFVISRYSDIHDRPQSMTNYYDLLVYGAFGNFRDLIEKVSLHPSMGTFLTMINSKKENSETGTQPDENYAREVMQLFTIGLYQLNNDGSIQTDSSGEPIEAYDQEDIRNVAKAFTGWVRDSSDSLYVKPMVAKDSNHDESEKVVMGHVIPAGQTAEQDMSDVMDILFNHDNTPPFFAKHMIKRLITSNPSPEYIERVANVFIDNGEGVRGDLRAVIEAILLDKEALAQDENNPPIKIKEPAIVVVNLFRALDLQLTTGRVSNSDIPFYRVGQGPLRAKSVFNFYSQDHSPIGTDLYAPELQVMTWPNFVSSFNYMRTFIAKWRTPTLPNYSYYKAAGDDMDEFIRRIGLVFFGGDIDPNLEAVLRTHIKSIGGKPKNEWAVEQLMEYIISAEDFYVQD